LAAAEVALLATIVAHPTLTTSPPLVALQPGGAVEVQHGTSSADGGDEQMFGAK
jgi:hypothetical protein